MENSEKMMILLKKSFDENDFYEKCFDAGIENEDEIIKFFIMNEEFLGLSRG